MRVLPAPHAWATCCANRDSTLPEWQAGSKIFCVYQLFRRYQSCFNATMNLTGIIIVIHHLFLYKHGLSLGHAAVACILKPVFLNSITTNILLLLSYRTSLKPSAFSPAKKGPYSSLPPSTKRLLTSATHNQPPGFSTLAASSKNAG